MQNNDFEWFLINYNKLFKKYGDSYLSIKNQIVIGSYNSYSIALKETVKNEELGTFIIQKCDGSKDAYTNYISSMNFFSC